MCNTYVIRPKRGAHGLAQRVGEATAKLADVAGRRIPRSVLPRQGRREERWLREKFPEYANYERQVRGFVPWR